MLPRFDLSPYPGRGVIAGVERGGRAFWVYFVTGRSDASRGRSLRAGTDSITVQPVDQSAAADDLRHYACLRNTEHFVVVGNGSHVSDIADRLERGETFERAYEPVRPEPDPPIFTPRIALARGPDGTWMGTVRRDGVDDHHDTRRIAETSGLGYVLTTYQGDAGSVRPAGPAHEIDDVVSLIDTVDSVWAQLDARYRVVVAGGYFDAAPAIEHIVST